jgi:hypothetical protein
MPRTRPEPLVTWTEAPEMPDAGPALFTCDACDAFPYDRQVDLDAHVRECHPARPRRAAAPSAPPAPRPQPAPANPEPTACGRFERVDNGFGGTTTRRVRPVAAPTDRQKSYVRKLLAERAGLEAAEAVRSRLNEARVAGNLDRTMVSGAIDSLLAIRPTPAASPARQAAPPAVPEGRYAFTTDEGHTGFAKVDHGKEGTRWEGYTFTSLLIGSPTSLREQRLDRATSAAILAKIAAAGIAESAARFGHEIGRCGRCMAPLTHHRSLAAGYGQKCAGDMGWPW